MPLLFRFFMHFCYFVVTLWTIVHHHNTTMKSKFTPAPNDLLDAINSIETLSAISLILASIFLQSKCIFIKESINTNSMVLLLCTQIACMFLSLVITLITGNKPQHKCFLTYYASLEHISTWNRSL